MLPRPSTVVALCLGLLLGSSFAATAARVQKPVATPSPPPYTGVTVEYRILPYDLAKLDFSSALLVELLNENEGLEGWHIVQVPRLDEMMMWREVPRKTE